MPQAASKPITARFDSALRAAVVARRPIEAIRAGSGLLQCGDRLLAIQDDAWAAILVDPETGRCETVPLAERADRLPKRRKPDFEAALLDAAGRVWILGSGSAPSRQIAVVWQPGMPLVDLVDLSPLYAAVAEAVGEVPNIEGAVGAGDSWRLFHRGSGRAASSIALEVPLHSGAPRAMISRLERYDLGGAGAVPLAFTDVTDLGGGSLLYLAVAEDTPDAIRDGPIGGAAAGLLEPGQARWTWILDEAGNRCRSKVEGVTLARGSGKAYAITDPDDARRPSQLLDLDLTGPWR